MREGRWGGRGEGCRKIREVVSEHVHYNFKKPPVFSRVYTVWRLKKKWRKVSVFKAIISTLYFFLFTYTNVLIDIPFKGCQGRSNRLSIVHAVIFCMRCHWHCMHFFSFFCIPKPFRLWFLLFEVVEIFCMRYQWPVKNCTYPLYNLKHFNSTAISWFLT
jgi:hypothetical protein